VGRLNRWLVAAAVAASGGLSIAAANAFHGHTRGQSTSASNAVSHRSTSGDDDSSNSSGDDSNDSGESHSSDHGSHSSATGGLQPPAQAPSPAPASPSGGVVSGGS
jgi:hypothetical protein